MRTFISIPVVAAIIATAQAANVPAALADFHLPTGDTQGTCLPVIPKHTEEFAKMQAEITAKLQKLGEVKIREFMQKYNPDMLLAYDAELWDSTAAYDAYKKEWGKCQLQAQSNIQSLISLKPDSDGTWKLLAMVVNTQNRQGQILSLSSLKYDPQTNTWKSGFGDLTPTEFKVTDDYVFKAQIGTEWKLEKQDSFSKTNQMLRIAKTTDGNSVFISFISVERSIISGQVLSQEGYTLYFPIPKPQIKK